MNLKIIISHATQNILDPKTKKNLGCLSKRACIEIFTVTIISLNILELYFVHDLFLNFGLFRTSTCYRILRCVSGCFKVCFRIGNSDSLEFCHILTIAWTHGHFRPRAMFDHACRFNRKCLTIRPRAMYQF